MHTPSRDADKVTYLKLVAIGIPDRGLTPGSHCNLSVD